MICIIINFRSSRLGPLVQCDFCPCVFHMDCLDPPLAEIPSDVWMCPNHVESLLDSRLTSSRLTERVNLWDKFANQQLDGHAVKLQFLKKCARKNPMFTRRVATVAARKRVQVICLKETVNVIVWDPYLKSSMCYSQRL